MERKSVPTAGIQTKTYSSPRLETDVPVYCLSILTTTFQQPFTRPDESTAPTLDI
jgi:hypothetical protein